MKQRLVLFASGSGSNAENVANYFKDSKEVEIVALFCNKANAGVIPKMEKLQIPVTIFDKNTFNNETAFLALLAPYQASLIALLGFLWKVPAFLVRAYPQQIINLHPALLPKFGGKGMYGHFVHEAVKAQGERETGITIHFVNEHYDEGQIIAQYKCEVLESDTAESIAEKIHELEQTFVPQCIQKVIATL